MTRPLMRRFEVFEDGGVDLTDLTATADELNVLDDVTAGTAAASKAVVLDSSKGISTITTLGVTNLTLGGAGTYKIAAVSLGATELGGTETDTSFTFPASGAIFLNAWLKVTDAEAGGTVDVGTQGTSNDPDGILDGVSLATTGYVGPVSTVGLTGKFITGADPVSVTSSGDLNSCAATLYILYIELPSLA